MSTLKYNFRSHVASRQRCDICRSPSYSLYSCYIHGQRYCEWCRMRAGPCTLCAADSGCACYFYMIDKNGCRLCKTCLEDSIVCDVCTCFKIKVCTICRERYCSTCQSERCKCDCLINYCTTCLQVHQTECSCSECKVYMCRKMSIRCRACREIVCKNHTHYLLGHSFCRNCCVPKRKLVAILDIFPIDIIKMVERCMRAITVDIKSDFLRSIMFDKGSMMPRCISCGERTNRIGYKVSCEDCGRNEQAKICKECANILCNLSQKKLMKIGFRKCKRTGKIICRVCL